MRIVHCDDSESVRRLVELFLRPLPAVEIVEQVGSHAEAIACAASLQPHLVLLDLDAGRDDQVVERLREVCSARVLILSGLTDVAGDPIVEQADGFVTKAAGAQGIARAVLAVSD